MKKHLMIVVFILGSISTAVLFSNCSQGFTAVNPASLTSSTSSVTLPVSASQANVMPVTIGCGYVNEPCVSVTICKPGTTSCQTIPNVLLDTGSYGLRLFSSAISISLNQETTSSGQSIAECVSYADGSSDWGPVQTADVVMGTEKASSVPIQIINSSFSKAPSTCTDLDTSPTANGYNGIIGVGLFTQDCGSDCVSDASNGIYYSCSGTTCSGAAVALSQQVVNPVSLMPTDNNGVILQLPSVASTGATSASGYLILGIGTQTNNTSSSVTLLPADSSGNFKTSFNGSTYSTAFIDSGSNGLFFPAISSLPECTTDTGFFCPTSILSFSATQNGANGSGSKSVSFQIMNAESALASSNPNVVFNDLGGTMSQDFDWGLPFFLGRTIFVGIENKASNLGVGPYWAY